MSIRYRESRLRRHMLYRKHQELYERYLSLCEQLDGVDDREVQFTLKNKIEDLKKQMDAIRRNLRFESM